MTPAVVVKYFFEEPASLEALAGAAQVPTTSGSGSSSRPTARSPAAPRSLEEFLAQPRLYRGYLAASHLPSGQVGATAPLCVGAWIDGVATALDGLGLGLLREGRVTPGSTAHLLREGQRGDVLFEVSAGQIRLPGRVDGLSREVADVLRPLLEQGATFLLAEAAPDGVDWTLVSGIPLRDRVRDGLQAHPAPDRAAFVIPQVRARGEHKFYFERYDLDLFAEFRLPPG